jgi:hypothetical protein
MNVYRHTSTVIGNTNAAVLLQFDVDAAAKAGEVLIYAIV